MRGRVCKNKIEGMRERRRYGEEWSDKLRKGSGGREDIWVRDNIWVREGEEKNTEMRKRVDGDWVIGERMRDSKYKYSIMKK